MFGGKERALGRCANTRKNTAVDREVTDTLCCTFQLLMLRCGHGNKVVAACSDNAVLRRAWREAVERLWQAARSLRVNMGTLPKKEYARLRAEVESAKLDATNARMMLELPQQEHGC